MIKFVILGLIRYNLCLYTLWSCLLSIDYLDSDEQRFINKGLLPTGYKQLSVIVSACH